MPVRTARIAAALGVLALAGTLNAGGSAEPFAPKVVDRTFSCAAGFVGGVHQVNLAVEFPTQPGSSRRRPSAGVTRNMFEAALGFLSSDGISVHRELCSPAKGTVRLTTKGMRGGGVPALGAEARCQTPRRFLLRVRAEFDTRPTTATVRQFGFPQLVVRGDVRRAALAVGTRTGAPIAYVALAENDRARLFTVRTCKED